MLTRVPRIGLFDSGVGGLSVLRALRARTPQAHLLYVADSGHAPYGERGDAFVQQRSLHIARFLRTQDINVLVVACNTATTSAIDLLRQTHADLPIVGVEPGVKPAVAISRHGRIGVMATEGTLLSEKFQRLMRAHAGSAQLHLQPCPGLAHAIEEGDPNAPAVQALVARFCTPLREQQVDTVVLGCTHYAFVSHHIQAQLGAEVRLIDTADAVAQRTLAQLPAQNPPVQTEDPTTQLWTSADGSTLARIAQQWLGTQVSVSALPPAV